MAKKKNPADATGRNIRHGNKRDDKQDERFHMLERAVNDRMDRLDRETNVRLDRLAKKVKKLRKKA